MQAQLARIEFTNHLMFNAVLTENEELCKRLIGAVLGKQVDDIEYIDDEHAIQPDIDARGARLDVLALIDGEYVDVEMQVGREPDIARRCRFYHSAIATRFTPKGSDYKNVPVSYVIFICLDDPLGAGIPRYELATACVNRPGIEVDDGTLTILYNASAWAQEENAEIAGMLHYVMTGSSDSGLARAIAQAVDTKNDDRKWVRASMGVMTYEHEMRVLNHELADRETTIEQQRVELERQRAELEQQRAELDSLRSMVAKLLAGEEIGPETASLQNHELDETLISELKQAE